MVGLVADDLTGACDSAVAFAGGGRVEVGLWPHIPTGDLACAAVSTESRAGLPAAAFLRSQFAAHHLRSQGASLMYRKVDSQLRGNVAADVAGILAEYEGPCLFAPALPLAGRVTRSGHQRWDDSDVDIVALLAETNRPVRTGNPEEYFDGGITVCDAASDEDLRRVARVAATTPGILPVGTAGLAQQFGQTLHASRSASLGWPACTRPAAVVGSPAALAQAERARDEGWPVLWLTEIGAAPELGSYDGLVLTGGETAYRVLSALGATGLEIFTELLPLVPVGAVIGGPRHGLPVAMKSGALGDVETLRLALTRLAAGG